MAKKNNVNSVILVAVGAVAFIAIMVGMVHMIFNHSFFKVHLSMQVAIGILIIALLIQQFYILPNFLNAYGESYKYVTKYIVENHYGEEFDEEELGEYVFEKKDYIPFFNELAIMELPFKIAQIVGAVFVILFLMITFSKASVLYKIFGGMSYKIVSNDFYLLVIGCLIFFISRGIFYVLRYRQIEIFLVEVCKVEDKIVGKFGNLLMPLSAFCPLLRMYYFAMVTEECFTVSNAGLRMENAKDVFE